MVRMVRASSFVVTISVACASRAPAATNDTATLWPLRPIHSAPCRTSSRKLLAVVRRSFFIEVATQMRDDQRSPRSSSNALAISSDGCRTVRYCSADPGLSSRPHMLFLSLEDGPQHFVGFDGQTVTVELGLGEDFWCPNNGREFGVRGVSNHPFPFNQHILKPPLP